MRIAVWSCILPGRAAPDHSRRPAVADGGGVLLLLAGDERLAAGAAGPRAADLGLGAVDAQLDTLGLGVGEDIGQGAQADAGPVRGSDAANSQQRADLVDGAGDGWAGDAVEPCQCRVRQLQTQVDHGDQDSVGEDQLVIRPGSGGPLALSSTTLTQLGPTPPQPGVGQLLDQNAEMCTLKAAEGRMRQDRMGSVNATRHHQTVLPPSRHRSPAARAT
ncbi:hypothetical protein [Streptomyces sp. I8-5]|uniref:hypothetical protein n=1 Tax=Streptomyces sp. I8-5 TaxID=3104277 RepID=UPI00386DC31B